MVYYLKTYMEYARGQTSSRLLALLALCCLFFVPPATADHIERVLILHSYHPTLRWTAGIMAAIQDRLVTAHPDISLHVEYLDTKRNPDPGYINSYVEGVLPQKLAGRRFDLVLTSDNDAFNFVRSHRNDLFKDVPVVFCGVNGFAPEMIADLGGITGVTEAPSFKNTIELALKLHPGTRELILIGETLTETGRKIDTNLHRLTSQLPSELSVQFWNDRPLEELEPALGRLEQGQVVLLASVISNRSGQVLTYLDSVRQVRDHSPVPIYGSWDFFLGQGIVGGHLTSSQSQGNLAASLGLRILAGESADVIPVTTSDSNRYMFDYNELQRFGISLKQLPEQSTVINQPPSFYRLDKWQLWAGVTILLLLCFSLSLLIRIMFLRRKTEGALQSALHDTEESRDNIDAILRSVADGLIVTDLEDRVILINQSAEQLLDVSFKDTYYHPVETALQGKSFAGQMSQLLTGQSDEDSLELFFPDPKSGKPLTILMKTSPVHRRNNSIGGTVAILRDVTRERELDQIKSEFIATAAHELRTPLATILGYAELLLDKQGLTSFPAEQRHEYLGYIIEKSEALEKIIDELLDVGRIETDRTIVLDKQHCEMISMVKQIIKHYQQETSRHKFVASCPQECLYVEIDQAKMQRVFDNLLSNAIKYSPQGGTIRIEGRAIDHWLEVSITDEGIGISPEQRAQVFDKFYRADTSATAVGGLGLGLTISKGIVEAHGGRLWVESEIGQGTRVIFRLPLPKHTDEPGTNQDL